MAEGSWIDEVIGFWFEELEPGSWFRRDDSVDARVRERFEPLYERLRRLPISAYQTARESLAAVIVLDQFPRNMYRNTPQAFATDDLALAISKAAIERGFDLELTSQQRVLLYMPWQHAEDAGVQARSIELFGQLDNAETLDYARQHKEVVDRFGRFPHRNGILQRNSSAEEVEFLKTHKGF